jgi:hypothetical protein
VRATCDSLPSLQRRGCYHGLGYAAIQVVFDDPAALPDLCGSGAPEEQIVCVEGAIEKLAELREGRAKAACAFLEGELRGVCDAAVRRRMYALDKPTFNLYYDPAAIAARKGGAGHRASASPAAHHH